MTDQIMLSVVEILISIVIEGVILSMIFAFVANQTSEKQNNALKGEMANIETQNKFIYEQIIGKIETAKTEIISQIKESEADK
jgi:hypothetical protein